MLKRTVGATVTIVGLIAAGITIYTFLPVDELHPIIDLADSPLRLDPESPPQSSRPIIADELVLTATHVFDTPVYVVANHLRAEEGAILRAPEITIVAMRVTGGRIDASGRDGPDGPDANAPGHSGDPGQPGDSGGRIFVAAGLITNTNLDASGGRGGNGGHGRPGANGTDGKCDGFGGWRGATDGQRGGGGGRAGNGGNGGRITIVAPENAIRGSEPDVARGLRGDPGQGRSGGQGGTGCSGLGGVQGDHPDGALGAPGAPGRDGTDGRLVRFPVHFKDIARGVREVADAVHDPDLGKTSTLDAIKQRLATPPGD